MEDITNLTQLEELNFKWCNWGHVDYEPLNKLPNLKSVDFTSNTIDKGKTLTNASLETCLYDLNEGLCIAKDIKCIIEDLKAAYKPCDSSSNDKISTNGKCPSGECCSKYGYCGTRDKHCGSGGPSE